MLRRLPYRLMEGVSRFINQFNKVSTNWEGANSFYSRLYLQSITACLSENLSSRGPLKILDGGCGTGSIAVPLALAGHEVTGIDNHKVSLDIAREHIRASGVELNLKQGDLFEELKTIPEGSFDVVLCINVLYCVQNYADIIRECARILNAGGVFIATFRTHHYYITTLLRKGRYDKALFITDHSEGILRIATAPAYYNWQSTEDVERIMNKASLQLMGIKPYGLFSGSHDDGMAAVFDVSNISGKDQDSIIYELESRGWPDCTGAARFMLATGKKR